MANDNSQQSHTGRKVFIWFVIIMVAGFGLTYMICNWSYSEGDKAGVLLGFQHKGFLFKTYEGELNMGGMGNISSTTQQNMIWHFSVRDPAIADSLNHLDGRRVSLYYKEIVKSLFWQGETNYFVDGITVLDK